MISVREIQFEDLETINKWRNDKEIVDTLCNTFRYINFETERAWFENYMKNRNTNIRLAILDNDEFVGMVYLLNIDMLNQKADFGIQIGYSEKHSKGIGTEATKIMLNHAFNNLNLNKVYLTVLSKHQKAINLYDRCGFRLDGVLREEIYKNGKFEDLQMMSILKKEFRNLNYG